jgi:hypothetical protein
MQQLATTKILALQLCDIATPELWKQGLRSDDKTVAYMKPRARLAHTVLREEPLIRRRNRGSPVAAAYASTS